MSESAVTIPKLKTLVSKSPSIRNPPYFIHFGCWNKGKCDVSDTNKSGVSAVMRRIQTYIADTKYEPTFISVAGDNYYPNKSKNKDKKEKENTDVKSKDKTAKKEKNEVKQKIIVESELVSGFECLKSLNVPVKVILGNHDLETNRENKHSFLINGKAAESCQIIKLEKEITKPGVELKLDFLTKGDIPFIGTNTMVLMIDTSMYETDADDIAQYEECYGQITAESHNIIELRKHQKSRVLEAIKQNSHKTNIVVIGHHPITGYIIKKDKHKLVEPFPEFVELWQAIIAEATGKTLYYLCADKHFYQPGTVTIDYTPIHQYIVGTGGAELDTNPFKNPLTDRPIPIKNEPTNIESVTYSMTSRQILDSYSNYGFLTCTETSNQKLVFQFISIHFKHSLNLSAKSAKKLQYAERRNRQIRMTQSASLFRRRSRGLSRSRAASAGGKKPRTRKLYRRKQK